jgi:radical SAM superfamily enzyme
VFEDAYCRLKDSGLEVIIHVILGLPGETREDMLETVRYLSLLTPPPDGIKLQLLHILKGTELAREYEADPFPLFTLDSYCDLVVDCLKLLPPQTVVHRLTGDGPKRLLIDPQWSADKKRVLNTLSRKIREA